jgi:hypothetical protein
LSIAILTLFPTSPNMGYIISPTVGQVTYFNIYLTSASFFKAVCNAITSALKNDVSGFCLTTSKDSCFDPFITVMEGSKQESFEVVGQKPEKFVPKCSSLRIKSLFSILKKMVALNVVFTIIVAGIVCFF